MAETFEKWSQIIQSTEQYVWRVFGIEQRRNVRNTQKENEISFVVDMHDSQLNQALINRLGNLGVSDAIKNKKLCDGIAVFTITEDERAKTEQILRRESVTAKPYSPIASMLLS